MCARILINGDRLSGYGESPRHIMQPGSAVDWYQRLGASQKARYFAT